jgi:hypothetical protein
MTGKVSVLLNNMAGLSILNVNIGTDKILCSEYFSGKRL